MIERVPSLLTPVEMSHPGEETLDELASFDRELKEHLNRHIERGDFFPLLATYLGFLEETAADPSSVPPESLVQQARLVRSMRKSLQELAKTHHILQKAA